jgi:hypothetical protein
MSVQELNAVPRCRSTTLLSARVEKALAAYAVAAAAAGLGFVTLTPRAAAKIIYTPANLDIPVPEFSYAGSHWVTLNPK